MKPGKDHQLINLLISGIALLLGLIWMFAGNSLVKFLIPLENQNIVYYFFSGVIFSLAIIGLYGFIRTVLCFTEFLIDQDNFNFLSIFNTLNFTAYFFCTGHRLSPTTKHRWL